MHTSVAKDHSGGADGIAFGSSHFHAQTLFIEIKSFNLKAASAFATRWIDVNEILVYLGSFCAMLNYEVGVGRDL